MKRLQPIKILILVIVLLFSYFAHGQKNHLQNASQINDIQKLIRQNKFNEAIIKVNKLLQNDSLNSEYYYLKGQLFEQIGELDQSVKCIKKAYTLNSYNFKALYYLGTYHFKELFQQLENNGADSTIIRKAYLTQNYYEKYYSIINDSSVAFILRNIYQLTNQKDSFIDSINQIFDPESNYYRTTDSIKTFAQFPKGERAMYNFIGRSINMPYEAQLLRTNGRVLVTFIVEESGNIEHIRINKSLIPACDAEVVRVIKSMPDWIPATDLNSNPIRTVYRMPVKFTIH